MEPVVKCFEAGDEDRRRTVGAPIDPQGTNLKQSLYANVSRLEDYIGRRVPPSLRSLIDPADILQDTFVEAFRRAGEFSARGNDAAFRWLVTIARHRMAALA